jgi:hypothetical protein
VAACLPASPVEAVRNPMLHGDAAVVRYRYVNYRVS